MFVKREFEKTRNCLLTSYKFIFFLIFILKTSFSPHPLTDCRHAAESVKTSFTHRQARKAGFGKACESFWPLGISPSEASARQKNANTNVFDSHFWNIWHRKKRDEMHLSSGIEMAQLMHILMTIKLTARN